MSDAKADKNTPASPDPAPSKAHGDALLDGSGSRHGTPPQESRLSDDDASGPEGE
ncbi:MAG: hypothetical protein M3P40_12785 [Actinomycetota bacterium]|nr:hypothetical protein [Actinomycetota bacterium]